MPRSFLNSHSRSRDSLPSKPSITLLLPCPGQPRLLAYTLSSLVLHFPPRSRFSITIGYTPGDESTQEMAAWFRRRGLSIELRPMDLDEDPIGAAWTDFMARVIAADASPGRSPDSIWIVPPGMFFGPAAVDVAAMLGKRENEWSIRRSIHFRHDPRILFPETILGHAPDLDGQYAEQVRWPCFYRIVRAEFRENVQAGWDVQAGLQPRCQIVPAVVARRHGAAPIEHEWLSVRVPNLYEVRGECVPEEEEEAEAEEAGAMAGSTELRLPQLR